MPDVVASTVNNSTTASGSIEPTGAPGTLQAKKARGSILVKTNNVPSAIDDMTWHITLGGKTSLDIVTDYTHNENKIARDIYDACVNGDIGTDWDISMDKDTPSIKNNGQTVYFIRKVEGYSIDEFTVESDFFISGDVDDDDSAPGGANTPLPDLGGGFSDIGDGGPSYNSPIDLGEINLNSTLVFDHPKGSGRDAESTNFGPLWIYFPDSNRPVTVDNILAVDTTTTIADKIESALNDSDFFGIRYVQSVQRVGNKITITSKKGGKKWNGPIRLKLYPNRNLVDASEVFTNTIVDMSGGGESNPNLSLESETDYWYTVRYRYKDGYILSLIHI